MIISAVIAFFVLLMFLSNYTSFKAGESKGVISGFGHTMNSRFVHMRDLSNIGYLVASRKDKEALDYVKKALDDVESDPSVDQKEPEDVRCKS